jgi:hypothetical protein
MPANLTGKSFAENLNTKFRVRAETPRPVELELVEVKSYNAGPNEQHGMVRFSLYLYGPGDVYLPQRTYTLEHERMGELELFVVPVGIDERGYRYEIVFNYFKKNDE